VSRAPVVLLSFLALAATGCVGMTPTTFVTAHEANWISIEIREGVPYDLAWTRCLHVLAKTFELKLISKEEGLIQTEWTPTLGPATPTGGLASRATLLFSADRRVLQMKLDSRFRVFGGGNNSFLYGFDTGVTGTVKSDIMAVVGRTTR